MTATPNLHDRPNPPQKDRNPGENAGLFSVLSAAASLLVLGYGGSFLVGDGAGVWAIGFGCASIAYAVLALGALVCAHRSRSKSCILLSQVIGVGYLLVYVLAISAGTDTGFGPLGILVVALLVWCNWIAVTKVVRRP